MKTTWANAYTHTHTHLSHINTHTSITYSHDTGGKSTEKLRPHPFWSACTCLLLWFSFTLGSPFWLLFSFSSPFSYWIRSNRVDRPIQANSTQRTSYVHNTIPNATLILVKFESTMRFILQNIKVPRPKKNPYKSLPRSNVCCPNKRKARKKAAAAKAATTTAATTTTTKQ